MSDPVRDFAAELRQRLASPRPATPRPTDFEGIVRQVAAGGDTLERFVAAATAAGAQVSRCRVDDCTPRATAAALEHGRVVLLSLGGLPGRLASAADALRPALLAGGARLLSEGRWSEEELFAAEVAITGVAAAVAETGSIVCETGAGRSRSASLLPPVHVALVGRSQIVPDVYDYYAALAERAEQPSSSCLITGPSKTADIEGVLVTGVHGPRLAYIFVVEDA